MAFFRVNFGVVARSEGGSAFRRSAYQRCTRENGHDYSAKSEELVDAFMVMPDDAPAWAHDHQQLWARVEASEKRVDSQVSRTIEITIPREVPEQLRSDFIRHCMEPLRQQGMAAEISLHNEIGTDGREQPHAHCQLTMRKFKGDGFGGKERSWNTDFRADDGRKMRKQFADQMNAFFRAHDIHATVDHRSNRDRGLERPAPLEVPKRYWKQWERWKKADPHARPPKAIRDYQLWKQERDLTLARLEKARRGLEKAARDPIRKPPEAPQEARKAEGRPTPTSKRKPARAAAGVFYVGKRIENQRQAAAVARRWRQILPDAKVEAHGQFAMIHGNGWRIADFGNQCKLDTVTNDAIGALVRKARADWDGKLQAWGSEDFLNQCWLQCQRQGVKMSVRNNPDWRPDRATLRTWQAALGQQAAAMPPAGHDEHEYRGTTKMDANVNQVDDFEEEPEDEHSWRRPGRDDPEPVGPRFGM